jgi:uncharacterized protein
MKQNFAAFGTGALFAVGLVVSGMTKPSKVAGFLDLAGAWDASLMFVMIGAIAVHFIAYRMVMKRRSPLFDARFHVPTRKDIDPRLVAGAALFGVGWGLGGFCPGPGLVTAASGSLGAILFVAGMTAGMLVEQRLARASTRAQARAGAGGTVT